MKAAGNGHFDSVSMNEKHWSGCTALMKAVDSSRLDVALWFVNPLLT